MISCLCKCCLALALALSPIFCSLSLAQSNTDADVVCDGDILLVSISPVLPNGQFPVAVNGQTIDLPLIERIKVDGLDTRAIRLRIVESYKKQFGKTYAVQVQFKE